MRAHWKFFALTLVIGWFLGAASGVLITNFCNSRDTRGRMRERFFKELRLNDEQRTQATAILQTNRQKLDELFSETKVRVEEIRSSTRAQIRQLLTADQQVVFDKLHAKWETRLKKRLERMNERF